MYVSFLGIGGSDKSTRRTSVIQICNVFCKHFFFQNWISMVVKTASNIAHIALLIRIYN
jgi:hypothetical protein